MVDLEALAIGYQSQFLARCSDPAKVLGKYLAKLLGKYEVTWIEMSLLSFEIAPLL